jgi:sugar O-acyltransferase (sialic acid O-acetyltransferase NeuD family)
MIASGRPLVVFGASNILSDLVDCALAVGLRPTRVVLHLPEESDERSIPLAERLKMLSPLCPVPEIVTLAEFSPAPDELYILGPTTPTRSALAEVVQQRFQLRFHTLVHPTAYVSSLAQLGAGVFIGANSTIAPGAVLADHVFVNRGVTIGHDTHIGSFSRIQPGSNVGGLCRIGRGVTVGLGANVLERLIIGDGAFVGGGAVVIEDVPARVLVVGVPARIKKSLE